MKRLLAVASVAILITACGSDDDGGSDSGDGAQAEVAAIVIQAAADAGATPDEDCIRDAADRIDDTDAQALVDAGLDGDPDISAATGEILAEMLTC